MKTVVRIDFIIFDNGFFVYKYLTLYVLQNLMICLSSTYVSFSDYLYFYLLFHSNSKNILMKKLFLLFSFFPLLLKAQTNPTAFNVTANTHSIFTSWVNTSTAGSAPANIAFWVANGRQESTAPTVNGDWNCAYNLTANSRFVGRGADGISMVNTGTGGLATCANPTSTGTIYPYAVVLALNTTNRVSLQVAWTGGTVAVGARPYLLQLQYRIGSSGSFIDVSGAVYSANATAGNAQTFTSSLPVVCENQSLIQIRWIYIQPTAGSGTRPELRLDEISLNSSAASPTLAVTPTTITNLTYTTTNGGPSPADSVVVSGSALTGFPGDITVTTTDPTNFELSTTSKNTGFADNLTIPYTTSTLANTKIYVRLKAALPENPYTGNITFSGGGTSSPPSVSLSGSVTSVPPPIITTSGTLTAFSTFAGAPSASQSYTVSGVNLTDNITITPPAGYEIRTGVGSYATSLVLTQVSGNVETTSIDVRLVGTTAGSFAGNITHTTTGTSAVNVAVTGTVGAFCGTATDIATVRASIPEQGTYTGPAATIAGRVTALFGNNKFYIQDATGGFAVFSNVGGGVVAINGIALGDSVRVTGPKARFNGEIEFNGVTCVNKVTGTLSNVPPAIVFDSNTPPVGINLPTFLSNNEGKLVKVISVNLSSTGTFGSASNYPITACNSQGDGEIRVDVTATTIISQPIPMVSQDITGVVGHYINASATVNIFQLFPRIIADFGTSTIACITPVASPSASCGPLTFASTPLDSTLDVTCWNVEWLGNTTTSPSPLGPTNDALQMSNVMTVLNTIKSDIFCIEEVCDHKQFIARVKTDLPKYKARCQTKYYSHFFDSPETTNATTFAQKVCFVYDSTVVTMVDTLSLLVDKYRYDTLNAPPDLPPFQNNWASGRLPFLFIGDVKIGNITKQIHFVGLHAKSGSAVADYNRRKQDVIDLKVKLDTDYPNANIIMLGDYNDDLDTSIAAGKASSYANFVSDNVNYKQISRALSLCGVSSTASYPDIIDHFMMSNEFGVLAASGPTPSSSLSGIYYLEKTINVSRPITYVSSYTSTTSDHYPVNARFTFNLPIEIISVNTGNWSSPSTWNCNCVPSSSSNVTIDAAHTVTVDVTSQARSLNVKGTLNWVASFILSLGQ